jgi:aspartate/methionine/tyrosine aminotransferase
LRQAREAIANYYSGRCGFFGSAGALDPDRIVITSSTSEAYTYVFRLLCEVGDEILAPTPSYPLFEYLAGLADIRQATYSLLYDEGWQLDFPALSAALTDRSRAVLVVHPNNPTGSFVKNNEGVRLAELCAGHDAAVIADEVFLDNCDGPARPASFALDSPALTFALSGLSKISLLPQMKLAWMVVSGPDALVREAMQRLEVISDTYLSPSIPGQLALADLLSIHENLQAQLRRRICSNLGFLDSVLAKRGLVSRLKREGGWYAVLRAPVTGSDEDLAIRLLQSCGVLVHPGHFFDFPNEGFFVISLIPSEDEFREAARRLHEFFETQAG